MSTTLTRPRTQAPADPAPTPPAPAAPKPGPARLVSLDAYRGFIMLAMASGGLGFAKISGMITARPFAHAIATVGSGSPLATAASASVTPAEVPPSPEFWHFLGYQFDHVAWTGCAFWDLIQPSFMFMVGVALPYSLASRQAKGEAYGWSLLHAAWRALLLILLAVFLSSPARLSPGHQGYTGTTTYWVFTNVLAQIGLGYVFVFLLAGRGWKVQWGALLAILVGYTLFFGLWPLPSEGFDWHSVQRAPYVEPVTGWFAHWNKNANAAHDFDVWFLNIFPQAEPFVFNVGGYQTLNFVPSMATMILGLMAGELLRSERSKGRKFLYLALAAVGCLAVGALMGMVMCPIVKRIWTPSWAVFSAGWTFAMLAAFYGVIDIVGWKRWAFPFVVVGMNSIAMYVMSQLIKGWVGRSLETHFSKVPFAGDYGPIVMSVGVLAVLWVFCLWMYRRKLFLRI